MTLPPLDAELILAVTVRLIATLPQDLYEMMKWHALAETK
jgi:hypothetical protein